MASVYLIRHPLQGYDQIILSQAPAGDQWEQILARCAAKFGDESRAFLSREIVPSYVEVRVLGPDDDVPAFVPQPDAGPEAPWDGIDPSTRNNE